MGPMSGATRGARSALYWAPTPDRFRGRYGAFAVHAERVDPATGVHL